jgi:hypothetical protein
MDRPLTYGRVQRLEEICGVEAETFGLLFTLLKESGYRISDSRRKAVQLLPCFDSITFRSDILELKPLADGTVSYTQINHQGIHDLVTRRFGNELEGRPYLALLNESLGVPLELYYALQRTLRRGIRKLGKMKDLAPDRVLPTYVENARQLRKPFLPLFNEGLRDPFAAYRETTLENFELLSLVFEHYRDLDRGKAASLAPILKFIARSSRLVFFRHYEAVVPALWLKANCGFRSTRQDQAAVKECLAILKQARTMPDFLHRLGIGGFIMREGSRLEGGKAP